MNANASETIVINNKITIPLSELDFRFSTSGGPGGQHANRAATKVTLLFDVAHSPSLDKETRARLLQKLDNRIDKQGVLQVQAQESRSQKQNRDTAVRRFQALLATALKRPKRRRKTKPSRAANERRLQKKKRRGRKKRDRSRDWKKERW